MNDSWAALTNPQQAAFFRSGGLPFSVHAAKLYPSGWLLRNQAGLFRLETETLLPVVDPSSHRIYPLAPELLSQALRRAYVKVDPFARAVIPWQQTWFADAMLSTAHTQAAVDLAAIACALERWKRTHKTYPDKLHQLEPLPRDPLSGQPFHYRRLTNGRYLLYSVGWNQTDDHGEVAAPRPAAPVDLRRGDWVWRYP